MLYGRRRGRALKESREHLLEHELPKWELKVDGESFIGLFDPTSYPSMALEVGFGSGEHLALQAMTSRETLFIGCEPFVNGVASMVEKIHQQGLTNVRIFADDVFLMLPHLPLGSFDHIFVLFPDPWPKTRHHKRRLVSLNSVGRLMTYLKPKGDLLVATDHVGYQEWIQDFWREVPGIKTISAAPPPLWTTTRYQEKAIHAGRASMFFHVLRN